MKPLEILIMVALVGAGILLYDTFGGTPPQATGPTQVQPRVETPAPRPDPLDDGLRSEEIRVLRMRIEELEERFAALEGAEVGADGGRRAPVGDGPTTAPERWEPRDLQEGDAHPFEEQELAWFRAMEEAVAERRRREASERSIRLQLKRAEISLAEEDLKAVLEATLTYRGRNRGIYRKGADEKWSPETRRAALEKSRETYRTTLTQVVPRDADRVLEALGRYPGFRPSAPFGGPR